MNEANTQVARAPVPNVLPAFTVTKIPGKVDHIIHTFKKDGGGIETKTVKEDGGFMVHFPIKGNSIRVRTISDLKRLGFDQTIPMVDSRYDQVVAEQPNMIGE